MSLARERDKYRTHTHVLCILPADKHGRSNTLSLVSSRLPTPKRLALLCRVSTGMGIESGRDATAKRKKNGKRIEKH